MDSHLFTDIRFHNANGYTYEAEEISVSVIKQGAELDGLRFIGWGFPGNTYDCGDGHLGFLAVDEGVDYHWYRYDMASGNWSHKEGLRKALFVDHSGKLILNPLTADRGVYIEAGGFYCICGNSLNIQ